MDCDRTEDLLAEIERVNEQNVDPNWTVGSLDVEALYPTLDVDECAKVVGDTLYNSNIVIEGLQWKNIALYKKYHATEEQTRKYRIKTFLPHRRATRGRRPKFIASGSDPRRKQETTHGHSERKNHTKKECGKCSV